MNYYYDIILNWGIDYEYAFYEWYPEDSLELAKKIPLFRVNHRDFVEMYSNDFLVEREFLDTLLDKTIISGKKMVNKIKYACLITDAKNIFAVEFNQNGEVLARSNILLDDDLNVIDFSYSLKEKEIPYQIKGKRIIKRSLRNEEEARKVINLELDSLKKDNNLAKLKYLYFEYKGIEENDLNKIYQEIKKDVESSFNENILKLYYIIKLSYHNV